MTKEITTILIIGLVSIAGMVYCVIKVLQNLIGIKCDIYETRIEILQGQIEYLKKQVKIEQEYQKRLRDLS
jgi:hypothetical protein